MDYTKLAEEFLEVTFELNKKSQQKIMDEFTKGEGFVLYFLHKSKQNAIPSDISNMMNISSAKVAALLNKLEVKKLIVRKVDASNRRLILVDLTAEGEVAAEAQYHMVIDKTVEVLKKLGVEDAKEFVRITKNLASIYEDLPIFDEFQDYLYG